MNYLLWDELAEAKQDDEDDEPLLSIKSLPGGHVLDVAMMTSTSTGHLISAGLDRIIQVWDVRTGSRARIVSDPEHPEENPFPVLAMTTSRDSNWLALLSPKGVLLWNLLERKWEKSVEVDMVGHKSESFFFSEERHGPTIPSVVIVRRNGTMLEVQLERDSVKEYLVCKTPLICVVPTEERCECYYWGQVSTCHGANSPNSLRQSIGSPPNYSYSIPEKLYPPSHQE
jgi:hypothetical protein